MLLSVARAIGRGPDSSLAMPVVRSVRRLEARIANLLLPRRNAMTRLSLARSVPIAAAFVVLGFLLSAKRAARGHDRSRREY